jgi:anti-anti-sigma factor
MHRTVRHIGSLTILDIDGRITRNEGCRSIKKKVSELLAVGHRLLLLNRKDVPYMDSTSVGELVSAFITVRNHDGILKLVGPTQRIAELLSIAKLDTVFEVCDIETDALESFSSP